MHFFDSLLQGLDIVTYADWKTFDQRLSEAIASGRARRVPREKVIHLRDEEWYLDPESGDIYVYARPDDKVSAVWEMVDTLAPPAQVEASAKSLNAHGLRAIPQEEMDQVSGDSLKFMLNLMIKQDRAELVSSETYLDDIKGLIAVSTYRDLLSGRLYQYLEYLRTHRAEWLLVQDSTKVIPPA